jgi:V8-like Glu-specific endopeptidase
LKDKLDKIEDYILSYRISTNPGQSGCPVITGKNRNLVVGLHKAGARDGEYNIGRKVTLEMIIQMLVWREAHGGMKFQVINYITGQ